jgi:hypothetical protein
MGMEATLVKKALGDHSFPLDDGKESRVLKASSTPEHVHHQVRTIKICHANLNNIVIIKET